MRDLVLAIDVGLSWCKAAYLDPAGKIVATGRSYTRAIPRARTATLDSLWQAVGTSVRDASAQFVTQHGTSARPAAIALSARGEFGMCIDRHGQGFWPIWDYEISWSSSYGQQAYAPEAWGEKDPFAFGYAIRTASFLLYLKMERPDEWRRIAHIGALRDYLVYRLAGVWVTDPTSGPGLATEWPQEIIDLTETPRTVFPIPLPPEQIVGGLLPEAAQWLDLPPGTPIAVGMHDGASSSIGARATEVGDACLTLGTNYVLRAVTGARLSARSFSYLVMADRWAWVNNVHHASGQLDMVADMVAQSLGASAPQEARILHPALGAAAAEVAPGCDGLVIERMVAGQEAAFQARLAQAQQAGQSKGHIYRAVMEAVARGVLELLQRAQRDGARPARFVAAGGGVHNRHFLCLLAAMLNAPIEVAEAEAGLIGAGIAAATGSGWYASLPAAVAAMTSPGEIIYPDPATAQRYRALHGV